MHLCVWVYKWSSWNIISRMLNATSNVPRTQKCEEHAAQLACRVTSWMKSYTLYVTAALTYLLPFSIDFWSCSQYNTREELRRALQECCVKLLALMLWLLSLCLTGSYCSCRHYGPDCRPDSRRDIGTSSACTSILKLQEYRLHGNGQPYTNLLLYHLSSCRFAFITESCANDFLRFHVTTSSRWRCTYHPCYAQRSCIDYDRFYGLHIYLQYVHQEESLLQHLLSSLCQSMYQVWKLLLKALASFLLQRYELA